MINAQLIDEIANKITAAMPEGVSEIQRDVEKNIKVVLQSSFSKFNLVTREEFDVQTRVLENTRNKLHELENQIAQLEEQLKK